MPLVRSKLRPKVNRSFDESRVGMPITVRSERQSGRESEPACDGLSYHRADDPKGCRVEFATAPGGADARRQRIGPAITPRRAR